ncbi:hypothetical protein [Streptomyces zagrosensis]|uniref:Uncharacterized protein n=1 Tax=Streptomyces zagrosensis TaxID=1042984 RepID=A0A7W9UZ50_9ACTN|nr:hypothetical protein [Streptomyces zagrosensis]MBB5936633.1 hypothetical protein [Streptomyces zagrosensis]
MFRQGDVLIVPVAQAALPPGTDALPRQPRDGRGRLVLALGEVTGHAHAVVGPGTLVREPGQFSAAYLHVPDGGRVVHEEHAPIALPKGWYRVVRQREYVPGAVRVVAD